MDIRQLRYFVTVAEEANFTRAAARLHLAQPGVSAQVRQLERELGQPLLDRSGRSVTLTEVGLAVLPYARAALSAVEAVRQTVDEFTGLLRGHVTIGFLSGAAAHTFDLASFLAGLPPRPPPGRGHPDREHVRADARRAASRRARCRGGRTRGRGTPTGHLAPGPDRRTPGRRRRPGRPRPHAHGPHGHSVGRAPRPPADQPAARHRHPRRTRARLRAGRVPAPYRLRSGRAPVPRAARRPRARRGGGAGCSRPTRHQPSGCAPWRSPTPGYAAAWRWPGGRTDRQARPQRPSWACSARPSPRREPSRHIPGMCRRPDGCGPGSCWTEHGPLTSRATAKETPCRPSP